MVYHTEGNIMFMIKQLIQAGITKDECYRMLGFSVASNEASLIKKIYNSNVFKLYQALNDIGYQKCQELQAFERIIHGAGIHTAFLACSMNFTDFVRRCELLTKLNTSIITISSSIKNDRFYINIHNNVPELSFYSAQSFFFMLAFCAEEIFHVDKSHLDAELSVSQAYIPDEGMIVRHVTDKINVNARATHISFPLSLLDLKNNSFNSYSASFIDKQFSHCYGMLTNGELNKLQSVVCGHIDSLLAEAHHELNIDFIAKRMNMSRSTLYRQLVSEGITFSELVDIERRKYALNYIQQSNMSLSEISDRLRYSNLSAFTRAFKRWYNISPSCLRHGNGGML